MSPGFDNAALVQHHDAVGSLDGRQSVRDHQRRAPRHQPLERLHHLALGHGIECAGWLVQDQDRRIFQNSPRDGKALALSAYRARKLDGVTQYDNSALKVHTRFGPLRILVATVPFHTSPGSFVYESDFTAPVAGPAVTEPSFLLDPFDYERQNAMQKAVEAGQSEFYLLPPGHVTVDGKTFVPIFEKPIQP